MHYRWEFVAADAIPRGAAVVTDQARIAEAVAYFRFLGDALALDDEGFHAGLLRPGVARLRADRARDLEGDVVAAEVLQTIVTVTSLGAGASTTIAHGLSSHGPSSTPFVIWPDRATPIGAVSATNSTITFTNFGNGTASATFLAQVTHTIMGSALPLYWQGGPGSGSAVAGVGDYLISNLPTLDLNVYVDSTNGSDANTGLTPLTALKTINAVYSKFPMWTLGGAKMTVNLAAGTSNTVASYPVRTVVTKGGDGAVQTYRYRGPAMVPATLTTGPTSVTGGLTITATGRRTQIDVAPSPAWTVEDLQGKFLRITRGGVKVVFEIPIAQNTTASRIFIDDEKLAPLVQATDTIEIVTPGAMLVSDVATLQILITGMSGYLPCQSFWGTDDNSQTFERIHISDFPVAMGVGGLTFDRCIIDNTPFIKQGSVSHINTIYSLGVKLSCMGTEFAIEGRPDSPSDPINTSVAMELVSFNLFLIGNPDGPGQYWPKRNMSVYNSGFAARGAIHVVGGGSLFYADDGGFVPSGAPVSLGGSGSLGPFIWAVFGAQVRINTTAGVSPRTWGTGTGSPLRVGPNNAGNAAIAYGTGVGAFEEVAGFNGNFTRVFAGTAAAPTGDPSRITILL
jgi:hypothetical protein